MLSKALLNFGRATLGKRTCLALRVARAQMSSDAAPAVAASSVPAELNLNAYPARLEDWENYKMPGAPYEGMGPLPPLPDYDPHALRHYCLPEYWFDFLYERTGASGLYTLLGASTLFALSKEYYVINADTYYTAYLLIALVTVNKALGPTIRQFFEDTRVDELVALDQVKAEEVDNLKSYLDDIKLQKWRAGVQELYNEARLTNVAMMLETAFIERQATVVNAIKNKLDYQVAVQKVDADLAQTHMVQWVEEKVMEQITPETQKETLAACIAELNALAAK